VVLLQSPGGAFLEELDKISPPVTGATGDLEEWWSLLQGRKIGEGLRRKRKAELLKVGAPDKGRAFLLEVGEEVDDSRIVGHGTTSNH